MPKDIAGVPVRVEVVGPIEKRAAWRRRRSNLAWSGASPVAFGGLGAIRDSRPGGLQDQMCVVVNPRRHREWGVGGVFHGDVALEDRVRMEEDLAFYF